MSTEYAIHTVPIDVSMSISSESVVTLLPKLSYELKNHSYKVFHLLAKILATSNNVMEKISMEW